MKSYDITDNFRNRVHTIRITFQYKEYKGHVSYEIRGNCRGLNVMDVDFDCWDNCDIENLKENDCSLIWLEEAGIWQMELKNDEGSTLIFEEEDGELNNYVVAVEIVDCRIEE